MKHTIAPEVIHLIMDKAEEISKNCPETCRDFEIMTSPLKEETLILRWVSIDTSNLSKIRQCYLYECFNLDGSPQDCSINYTSALEAQAFFESLTTHYQQQCAVDHRAL